MAAKKILITGATSGIGAATAALLKAQGHRVIGTTRGRPSADLVTMDVTDDMSVRVGVAQAEAMAGGPIDVLINNAGFGIAASIEDTTADDMRAQMDTNLFGVLRVSQAVLPSMRARRTGMIVNLGSLAGRIAVPFQGAYSASKFAVAGLTEALRIEVKPFGIRVALVEPGDHKSGFTEKRRFTDAVAHGAYAERTRRSIAVMAKAEQNGPPPERVAEAIAKLIDAEKPKLRTVVGSTGERFGLLLRHLMPQRSFEKLIAGIYDKK